MQEYTEKDSSYNEDVKPHKKEITKSQLREKAILLIAGKLDVSKESESDMKKIEEMRLEILTGHKAY